MDDWQSLNQYATRNSQEAFRALVDRYSGMVYHAALRQLGNPHAAEEVAQAVFIALAKKAGRISRHTLLPGWLFRATRFAVLNLRRDEACRLRYEHEAMESMTLSAEAESVWQQIAPRLDEALERLSRSDRELVMIRFFGNKSHKEAARILGITEDTAKKRLSRALEKLRTSFARRGIVVPAVTLAAALGAFGAQAAPAGLAASISTAALSHGATAASTCTLAQATLKLLAWAKAKTILALSAGVVLAAAGTATLALKAASPPADSLIAQLEHHSGKHIAWDKHLALTIDLDLSHLSLEQALDQLAVQASAYRTIDYVVYDSDQALRGLLNLLHEGTALEPGGWTNLSSLPLEPRVNGLPYDAHGRLRTFMRLQLVHTDMESMYGPPNLPATPDGMAGGMQSNRFNLSPQDRAAHQRAVDAWKKQNQP